MSLKMPKQEHELANSGTEGPWWIERVGNNAEPCILKANTALLCNIEQLCHILQNNSAYVGQH